MIPTRIIQFYAAFLDEPLVNVQCDNAVLDGLRRYIDLGEEQPCCTIGRAQSISRIMQLYFT